MKALLSLAILILLPATVTPATIKLEAENFTSSHDIAIESIRLYPYNGCSGGAMLVGLDYPGEWVKYTISITAFGIYSPSIVSRGDIGQKYSLSMEITPSGEAGPIQTINFSFNGKGYG